MFVVYNTIDFYPTVKEHNKNTSSFFPMQFIQNWTFIVSQIVFTI